MSYPAEPPRPSDDQPAYSPPPAPQSPYPAGTPVAAGSYGSTYPESSQATVALVLGIVGVLFVYLAAPFAWWLGAKEKKAIDAGRRDPANRGQAVVGWVLGIIGTIFLILVVIASVVGIVVVIAAAASSS